jgi:hypothetical protein
MGSYAGTVKCDAGFSFSGQGSDLITTVTLSAQPGAQAGGASVVLRLAAEWRGMFNLRCNYGMTSLCTRADDAQCAAGQEAWRCQVTGISVWSDSCVGQAVARPAVARVCYAGSLLTAKELSPSCKRMSGDLTLQQR